MTDSQNPAESAAGDEVVADQPDTGGAAEEQGQVKTPPATAEDAAQPAPEAEDQKTRSQKRREARKERQQHLERELAETKAKLDEVEGRKPADPNPRPEEAHFASLEEYQAALTAYSVSEALTGRDKAAIEADKAAINQRLQGLQAQQQSEVQAKWIEQTAEARSQFTDFDAVVSNPELLIPEHVAEEIKASDEAAMVAYHIAKNPEIARALAVLSGPALYREMGKIEAMVSMPKSQVLTSAPEPITPVTSQSTGSKNPANMTPDEYRAWRSSGGGS